MELKIMDDPCDKIQDICFDCACNLQKDPRVIIDWYRSMCHVCKQIKAITNYKYLETTKKKRND